MLKNAADFQSSMTRLVTSAGESESNLSEVSQGVLNIARQTGTSTTALASALYTIESGGQHGANGLNVLKAAAEGAKAENSGLATVADAVTSVLVDYHLQADASAEVTSKLVAATSAGKTSFEELAAAMPAILPVASAAHVSLNDILGDMAAMTIHGMSAQQSAQNLADTIRHMQNPTATQAKELALLDLTTTQLADDMKNKGLSGTLQEISDRIIKLMPAGSDKVILNLKTALDKLSPQVKALGLQLFNGTMSAKDYQQAALALDPISQKQASSFATLAGSMHRIGDQQMTGSQVMQNYGQALAKATGDSTGLNVALMLTGENSAVVNGAIKTVSAATSEAGNNVRGWSDIQKTFNQQMSVLKEDVSTTGIAIGSALLPPLTAAAKVVGETLGPLASFISAHKNVTAAVLLTAGALASFVAVSLAVQKSAKVTQAAFSPLIDVVKKFAASMRLLDAAEDGQGLKNVATELGAIGKVGSDGKIATTAADVAKIGSASTIAEGGVAGLADVLTGPVGIGLLAATVGTIGLIAVWKKLHDQSDSDNKTALTGTKALQEYSRVQGESKKATEDLTKAKQNLNNADKTVDRWLTTVQRDQDAVTQAYNRYGENSSQYASALDKLTRDTESLSSAQGKQKKAADTVKTAQDKLTSSNRALDKANNDVERSTITAGTYEARLTKDHNAVKKSADEVTKAQKDVDAAYKTFGAKSPQYQKAIQQLAKAHQDLDKAEKDAKSDAQNLVNYENGVIKLANGWITKFDAVGTASQKAAQQARGYATNAQGIAVPRFATGTPYAPGGLALVGERGPELVNLPQGTQVFPAQQTAGMLGNKSLVIEQLNINSNVDVGLVIRQIGWQLAMA